jgi:hypothetical protein
MSLPAKYPPQVTPASWNAMVDAANGMDLSGYTLEYSFNYIVRNVGGVYDAINKNGVLTYGGSSDAGGVDGGDAAAILQAIINTSTGVPLSIRCLGTITYGTTVTIAAKDFLTIVFDKIIMTEDDPAFMITGGYDNKGVVIRGVELQMNHDPFTDKAIDLRATHATIDIENLTVLGGIASSGTGLYIGFTIGIHMFGDVATETIGHNYVWAKIIYHSIAFIGVKMEETAGSYVSNNCIFRTLVQSQAAGDDIAFWNSGIGMSSGNELLCCQVSDSVGTSLTIQNSGILRVIGGDLGIVDLTGRVVNTGTIDFVCSRSNVYLFGATHWRNGDWDLNLSNVAAGVAWTDLDLSGISPFIKQATVNIRVDFDSIGAADYFYIQLRQKGVTDNEAHYAMFFVGHDATTAALPVYAQLTCGTDTSGILQYTIQLGAGWQADVKLSVCSYID